MPDLRRSAREQSGLCVLVRELVHVRVCAEGLQERPGPGPAPPSSCDSPGWSQLLGLFSWRFPPPAAWTRRSLPPGCPPGRPPVGLAQGGRGLSWGRHPLPQAAVGHLAQCLASLRWPRRGGVPRRRAGGSAGLRAPWAAPRPPHPAPRPALHSWAALLLW